MRNDGLVCGQVDRCETVGTFVRRSLWVGENDGASAYGRRLKKNVLPAAKVVGGFSVVVWGRCRGVVGCKMQTWGCRRGVVGCKMQTWACRRGVVGFKTQTRACRAQVLWVSNVASGCCAGTAGFRRGGHIQRMYSNAPPGAGRGVTQVSPISSQATR